MESGESLVALWSPCQVPGNIMRDTTCLYFSLGILMSDSYFLELFLGPGTLFFFFFS